MNFMKNTNGRALNVFKLEFQKLVQKLVKVVCAMPNVSLDKDDPPGSHYANFGVIFGSFLGFYPTTLRF